MNTREQTAVEARADYIQRMGPDLGSHFAALWQETASIHQTWLEYVELYGTSPSRIDLLNRAAPRFFRMVQDMLWDQVLLHIARVTERPSTGGQKRKNLTIQSLPPLISDTGLRPEVANLVQEAISASFFCRDLRNRKLAHNDLDVALEKTTPLAGASRAQVKAALAAICKVLNLVQMHYIQAETRFDLGIRIDGAHHLIYLLDDGLQHEECRKQRLLAGNYDDGHRSL